MSSDGTTFSCQMHIVRAIATACCVLSLSGCAEWLALSASVLGYSLLLTTVGYETAKSGAMEHGIAWTKQLFKQVYIPLVTWSTIVVVVHNTLIITGLIPGQTQHIGHHLWDVASSLTLQGDSWCVSFKLFVLLWICPLLFALFYRFVTLFSDSWSVTKRLALFIAISFSVTVLQMIVLRPITILPGTEALAALGCIGGGALLHHHPRWSKRDMLYALGVVLLSVVLFVASQIYTSILSTNAMMWVALPFVVCIVQGWIYFSARMTNENRSFIVKGLCYIGRHTLAIVGFCTLSFQIVNAIVIVATNMNSSTLATHHIIRNEAIADGWFMLYFIVGMTLPLLCIFSWKRLDERFHLTLKNCIIYLLKGLRYLIVAVYRFTKYLIRSTWHTIKQTATDLKDLLKASNPKEE